MSEPNAPPVMMIGPSAPNGPPDPIEIAADIGLSRATFGETRLPFDENRFNRLGDAVAADAFRAVSRHQADDQPPTTGIDDRGDAASACSSPANDRRDDACW